MIDLEVFLTGLMIVSTLTGLVTEELKKILAKYNAKYRANLLAGIVSTIISISIGVGYGAIVGASFNMQFVICVVSLVFMSWLCAMVGYDKVVGMFKTTDKED